MPGFVAPPQPIKLHAAYSQPLLLLGNAGLLVIAPLYEGMDPWLMEARHQLGEDTWQEIRDTFTATAGVYRFVEQVVAHTPKEIIAGPADAFIDALAQTPITQWAQWLHQALNRSKTTAISVEDAAAIVRHLQDNPFPPPDMDSAIMLLQHPERHKEQFCHGLRRFWEKVYLSCYQQELPRLRQAAAALENLPKPRLFRDLFGQITNRPLPFTLEQEADKVRTLIAVPMLHIGPYVVYHWRRRTLYLYYNARLTLSKSQTAAVPKQPLLEFYPALKALGDETRLQIVALLEQQEMYAQEIVAALDISQAAVSRHLRLLVSSGVLNVRRSGGQKFYQLNKETFRQLSAAFQQWSA